MSSTYSTKNVSKTLLNEVQEAIEEVKGYGSVEVYVQDNQVTQITVRSIKKTNGKR